MVKNPSLEEAGQLAIYKWGRGVELGATAKQLQIVVRTGLEPGTSGFQVRRPNHSTTQECLILNYAQQYLKKLFQAPGSTSLCNRHVQPQTVWFLGHFGLKYGEYFNHFDLQVWKRVCILETRSENGYKFQSWLGHQNKCYLWYGYQNITYFDLK